MASVISKSLESNRMKRKAENITMGIKRACSIGVPIKAVKTPKCPFICYECKVQFEVTEPQSPREEKETKCTECGSRDIQRVDNPSCSISTPGETSMLMWNYLCHNCRVQFKLPVPRGPREEKETKCAECGSRDIQRIMSCEDNNCPPGG